MEPTASAAAGVMSSAQVTWKTWAKVVIGLAVLGVLIVGGQIDLRLIAGLISDAPAIVASVALLLLSLPVAAMRWGTVLRILGAPTTFGPLYHFVAISMAANVLLLGTAGGDAVRGLYAWRALGGSGGRVALSIIADRLLSLAGMLLIATAAIAINWPRVREVPIVAGLATSIFLVTGAGLVAGGTLLAAPDLIAPFGRRLARWPRLVELVGQLSHLVSQLRSDPLRLLGALGLAIAGQFLSVGAAAVIIATARTGLSLPEISLALPFTLVANSLPLTPSGLGVGEVAFDQLCRWIERSPSGTPYLSIFFAYRMISTLSSIPGVISFVVYRRRAHSSPGG